MNVNEKGIALDVIGFIIIALVGIMLLLIFISGPLSNLAKNMFCFFYQNVLHQSSDMCLKEYSGKKLILCENLYPECDDVISSPDDLARHLAAYSVVCWKDVAWSRTTKDIICYNIILKTHPGIVTEFDITKMIENEIGCENLQNSVVVDVDGNLMNYPNCGVEDTIAWDVSNYVIDNQSLILIKYNTKTNQIVIKA